MMSNKVSHGPTIGRASMAVVPPRIGTRIISSRAHLLSQPRNPNGFQPAYPRAPFILRAAAVADAPPAAQQGAAILRGDTTGAAMVVDDAWVQASRSVFLWCTIARRTGIMDSAQPGMYEQPSLLPGDTGGRP